MEALGFDKALQLRPAAISEAEWELRLELAACYRLVDWYGWSETINNHISLRLPGEEKTFLINPYGLHYFEVTASNLVKIDLAGEKLDSSQYDVNRAGFVIHSAIHDARDDAHCILHTHTPEGVAVACKAGGLRNDNIYSYFLNGKVAYHDFEGVTTDIGERPRLVASLGKKNFLILRSHGLLAAGRTVAQTFHAYWTLQRACEIQVLTDSMSGPTLPVAQSVLDQAKERSSARTSRSAGRTASGRSKGDDMVFSAMLRKAGIRFEDIV
jgi:ribulose-5-phosphate 4-epimerase/fuculose-1-phosphate aldolase